MRIREDGVNENYRIRRYESEGGFWKWGMRPMLFGYRVTIGQCESPVLGVATIEADYCCGPELASAMFWTGFISAILHELPEEITAPELNRLFPRQKIKPLYNDPDCRAALEELAARVNRRPTPDQIIKTFDKMLGEENSNLEAPKETGQRRREK